MPADIISFIALWFLQTAIPENIFYTGFRTRTCTDCNISFIDRR
jgi:hypothetical protein